jgi:hypothetical protein
MSIVGRRVGMSVASTLTMAVAVCVAGCAANVGAEGEGTGTTSEAIGEAACATTPVASAGGATGAINFAIVAPNGAPCGAGGFTVASHNATYGNASCSSAYLVDVALSNAKIGAAVPVTVTDLNAATQAECATATFTIDAYADDGPEVLSTGTVAGTWSNGACVAFADAPVTYMVASKLLLREEVAKTLRLAVNAVSPKGSGKFKLLTPDLVVVEGGVNTCVF